MRSRWLRNRRSALYTGPWRARRARCPSLRSSVESFLPRAHIPFGSTANIAAGTTLTFSGAGTHIFQVGSAITANVGSNVVLSNGASACNVFWQVTSAATLNGVTFAGTVVAQAAVTLGVDAILTGRALTTAASVTMAGDNRVGGCSGAGGKCPPITLAPAILPNGTVGVAYSQTITGSGGALPYTFAVTAGALPAGVTLSANGVLTGTPTTGGQSIATIRATAANGCFAERSFTVSIVTAVPALPQAFVVLLAVGLMGGGYFWLQRRVRSL